MTQSDIPFDLSTALVSLDRTTVQDRPPARQVIVTGMHRSATSAVTQLLGGNGLDLGEPANLLEPDPTNPHGYFEHREIYRLNESLLGLAGGSWWSPPARDTIAGLSDEMARQIRPVWRKFLAGRERTVPATKDPRFCLLLPAWRQVLGNETLFVICVRDPLAVARSLLVRDLMDVTAGCALWEIYLVSCLKALSGAAALFVDIERIQTDQEARHTLVSRVRAAAGLPPSENLVDTFEGAILSPASPPQDLLDGLSGYQLALQRSLARLPLDVVEVGNLAHLRVSAAALRITASNARLVTERATTAAENVALREQQELSAASESQLREQIDQERSQLREQLDQERRELELLREQRELSAATESQLRAQLELEQRQRELAIVQRAETQGDLRELRREAEEHKTSAERLRHLLDAATLDSDNARGTIAGLEARLAQLEAENRRALEMSRAEHRQVLEELADTRRMHGAASTSKSWRWTRPLRREGRNNAKSDRVDAGDAEGRDPRVRPRVAVVVHMFYPELWRPLREQLANLQIPYHLFVSLTERRSEHLAGTILEDFPEATVRCVPNVGRDIAPFVELIRSGALDGYGAILKLHSKQSHHRVDGADWRTALWHGLLPSPQEAERFAAIVANNPEVGCIVPAGNILDAEWIGSNAERIETLLGRVGLGFSLDELRFPAGSMYWLDGSVVQLIGAVFGDSAADFEPELGQIDGTTAHAFERLLGVLLTQRGQIMLEAESAGDVPVAPAVR